MELPETINLSGILYRVQHHEGMITFTQESPVWSITGQFSFEKPNNECWYVKTSHPKENTMVSHIIKAYALVCDVFGKNHEIIKEV